MKNITLGENMSSFRTHLHREQNMGGASVKPTKVASTTAIATITTAVATTTALATITTAVATHYHDRYAQREKERFTRGRYITCSYTSHTTA